MCCTPASAYPLFFVKIEHVQHFMTIFFVRRCFGISGALRRIINEIEILKYMLYSHQADRKPIRSHLLMRYGKPVFDFKSESLLLKALSQRQ